MHDDSARILMNADRRGLIRAATRLLGPAEAEDAVQDAYVRALEADPAGLDVAQAWLLTVVRHLSIDRLRRRAWMQRWLEELGAGASASPPSALSMPSMSPSAEMDAELAQEVARALRLMASHLTPMDGAAVLLHEVFEVEHAEIARANEQSEAASRQRLRRALARLRQAAIDSAGTGRRHVDADADIQTEPDAVEDAVFRQYLDSLRLRDPRSLWAMLRQPPISATTAKSSTPVTPPTPATNFAVAAGSAPSSHGAACGVLQVGGQLGLVLTLDGVTLCVLPLGVRAGQDAEPVQA